MRWIRFDLESRRARRARRSRPVSGPGLAPRMKSGWVVAPLEHGSFGRFGPFSRRGRRGFSLIEILIAITILMIGMAGVMVLFTSAVDLHKRGIDQVSAAMLAETILEGAQAMVQEGVTCEELSTLDGGSYAFTQSTVYPAYDYKLICTELNEREYKLVVEVRMRPIAAQPRAPSSDLEREGANVRFETVLLRP